MANGCKTNCNFTWNNIHIGKINSNHSCKTSTFLQSNHQLVGGFNHLEKYEFVNGKDDIPYMKWKIKFIFQTTKQSKNIKNSVRKKHPVSDTPSARLLRLFHGMTLGIAQESRHHRAHVPAERRIFMGFPGEQIFKCQPVGPWRYMKILYEDYGVISYSMKIMKWVQVDQFDSLRMFPKPASAALQKSAHTGQWLCALAVLELDVNLPRPLTLRPDKRRGGWHEEGYVGQWWSDYSTVKIQASVHAGDG